MNFRDRSPQMPCQPEPLDPGRRAAA